MTETYQCPACGHFVADDKDCDSWVGQCPPEMNGGCNRIVNFQRVSSASKSIASE